MDGLIYGIEIFATITGVLYVLLEIGQKNIMWYVGIATGAACAFSFGVQHLYASMGLNLYYVFVSFWGLYQWKKDSALLSSGKGTSEDPAPSESIHLNKLNRLTLYYSAIGLLIGTPTLYMILDMTGDSMSMLDSATTVMSIIGTIWLAKSYWQQWYIWIIANILTTVLCFQTGMYWMTALYAVYVASAVYGCIHWKKKGQYVG